MPTSNTPIKAGPPETLSPGQIRLRLLQAQAEMDAGRIDQAMDLLHPDLLGAVDRAIRTGAVDLAFSVAGLFHQARLLDQAEQCYRMILDVSPHPLAYVNLGHLCHFTGRLAEAIEFRRKAMELCPDDASLGADLGSSLIFVGRKEEGIALLRRAKDLSGDRTIHSQYLMALHYLPELDTQALFDEHRLWARVHAPLALARQNHGNDRSPDRRLRIGYISPDFRTHPVANFLEPLLEGHNRDGVQVFGYSQVLCPDRTTSRLESKFDTFRQVCGLDDQVVASMIEQDRIDILVDLAGHTAGHRLGVLAYKPAPIQVTYLGYPDTTGMSQVDYRLTDSLSTPSQMQSCYVEELVYLPEGFLCYRPPDFAPDVAPLPAIEAGGVTFGVFNDTSKVNGTVISLWAQILAACPGSRLMLKSRAGDDPQVRQLLLDQFLRSGVPAERVRIEGQKPAIEYLRLYNQVDIALDTHPYNGTTTTCDALWMGVPVISLVGLHHAGRVGLSILSRLGLGFFAAMSAQEYVTKARALAHKPDALAKIRASIRPRMMESSMCQPKAFARTVETAYLCMWRAWCGGPGKDEGSTCRKS